MNAWAMQESNTGQKAQYSSASAVHPAPPGLVGRRRDRPQPVSGSALCSLHPAGCRWLKPGVVEHLQNVVPVHGVPPVMTSPVVQAVGVHQSDGCHP